MRTNLVTNPRASDATRWSATWGTGAAGTSTFASTGGTALPPGGTPNFMRSTLTTAQTTNSSMHFGVGRTTADDLVPPPVAGTVVVASIYVRSNSTAGIQAQLRLDVTDAVAGSQAQTAGPVLVLTTSWQRLTGVFTLNRNMNGWRVSANLGTVKPNVGEFVDVTCAQLEIAPTVGDYFDGDTPDTATTFYAWKGAANASASTETAPSIEARVLSGAQPQRVQVVVGDVPAGTAYTVRGTTADGNTWTAPGGQRIGGTETQVALNDTLAPLNVPVVYELVVGAATVASSDPVTVPWTGPGCAVIASLNGARFVPIAWVDNQLPEALEVYSTTFSVPGRARRPGRYTPTGDGSGTVEVLIASADRDAWAELLRPGEVVVTRTDGTIADWPAVEIIACTALSSVLRPLASDKTARLWSIEYELVDLPDPSFILIAYTWDEFDQIYAGQTWDAFDAEWAGQTWNDFDTHDWGQRL